MFLAHVSQYALLLQTEQEYEKEKLNERIARLSGGVAIIQARAVLWCAMPSSLLPLCSVFCLAGIFASPASFLQTSFATLLTSSHP